MRRSLIVFALVILPACRVTDIAFWKPVGRPDATEYAVETRRGISYYDGPGVDPGKHQLDVFLPKGKKNFPVVVLVHGGAWVLGDNRSCGLYSSVGETLARQGIGAVLPNYRLSPAVKHPEHVKDVARAFAWTKRHASELGGDPQRLFLVGHSAGGHLVTLAATDDTHLQSVGCRREDIRGVVGICGVYRIPEGKAEVELGGSAPDAFRFDEIAPVRGNGVTKGFLADAPGIPLKVNVFGPAFGNDPYVRWAASPLHHVRPGLPPFLLVSAEKDLPLLPAMARDMHEALQRVGVESRHITIERRNHSSVLFKTAEPGDPLARAIVEFVHGH